MIDPDTLRPALAEQFSGAFMEAAEAVQKILERLRAKGATDDLRDYTHSEALTLRAHWRAEYVGLQVVGGNVYFSLMTLYRNHTVFAEISGGVVMDYPVPVAA